MREEHKYVSDDGIAFDNRESCLRHEAAVKANDTVNIMLFDFDTRKRVIVRRGCSIKEIFRMYGLDLGIAITLDGINLNGSALEIPIGDYELDDCLLGSVRKFDNPEEWGNAIRHKHSTFCH